MAMGPGWLTPQEADSLSFLSHPKSCQACPGAYFSGVRLT